MGVAELRRLRQLEAEDRKLEKLVADLAKCSEKMVKPRRKSPMVEYLREVHGVSSRWPVGCYQCIVRRIDTSINPILTWHCVYGFVI